MEMVLLVAGARVPGGSRGRVLCAQEPVGPGGSGGPKGTCAVCLAMSRSVRGHAAGGGPRGPTLGIELWRQRVSLVERAGGGGPGNELCLVGRVYCGRGQNQGNAHDTVADAAGLATQCGAVEQPLLGHGGVCCKHRVFVLSDEGRNC